MMALGVMARMMMAPCVMASAVTARRVMPHVMHAA
jgi:hypothetical protein